MLNKKKIVGAALSLGILGCVGMSASPVALAESGQAERDLRSPTKATDGAPESKIKELWNGTKDLKAFYYSNEDDKKHELEEGRNEVDGEIYLVNPQNQIAVWNQKDRAPRVSFIMAKGEVYEMYSFDEYGRGYLMQICQVQNHHVESSTYFSYNFETKKGELIRDNGLMKDIDLVGIRKNGAKRILTKDGRWLSDTEIAIKGMTHEFTKEEWEQALAQKKRKS